MNNQGKLQKYFVSGFFAKMIFISIIFIGDINY